jgi:hypothetical protein
MAPEELLNRLTGLFPRFRTYWDGEDNCFRDSDGSFTLYGVFSEFTDFFREQYSSLPPDEIARLGAFVSDCMSSKDWDLDNAAATCFVENIAGEECDRDLRGHLFGPALDYWRAWGGREIE